MIKNLIRSNLETSRQYKYIFELEDIRHILQVDITTHIRS